VSTPIPPSRVPLRGAVDLAALAAAREAQAKAEERLASGEVTAPASTVVDVTEVDFQTAVLDLSFQVPVVVNLMSVRSPQSATLTPMLESLAAADGGTWLLANVDADVSPRIAQAFQAQAIPTAFAVIKGQPMGLFEGAVPAAQIRDVLDEMLRVAAANGLTGRVGDAAPEAGAEPLEPEVDPRYDAAFDAVEAGDWDAAEAAYRSLLESAPADEEAKAGLAQVALMRRTDGADAVEAMAAADAAPDSLEAQSLAADIELLTGQVDAAFARMIDLVRRSAGDERTAARDHVLSLFVLVGDADPRVIKARTALANALF
jgi:putative thioredoxin